jgi:hypothetical protein
LILDREVKWIRLLSWQTLKVCMEQSLFVVNPLLYAFV